MAASRGHEYHRTYARGHAFVLQGNAGVVNVHYHSRNDAPCKRQRETTFDNNDILVPSKRPRVWDAHANSECRIPDCVWDKKSQEHVDTQQVDHGLYEASPASNLEDRDGTESAIYKHCLNIFRIVSRYLEIPLQRTSSVLRINSLAQPSQPHEPSTNACTLVPAVVRHGKCSQHRPLERLALVWLVVCAVVASSHVEAQARSRILRRTVRSLYAAWPWLTATIVTLYSYRGILVRGPSELVDSCVKFQDMFGADFGIPLDVCLQYDTLRLYLKARFRDSPVEKFMASNDFNLKIGHGRGKAVRCSDWSRIQFTTESRLIIAIVVRTQGEVCPDCSKMLKRLVSNDMDLFCPQCERTFQSADQSTFICEESSGLAGNGLENPPPDSAPLPENSHSKQGKSLGVTDLRSNPSLRKVKHLDLLVCQSPGTDQVLFSQRELDDVHKIATHQAISSVDKPERDLIAETLPAVWICDIESSINISISSRRILEALNGAKDEQEKGRLNKLFTGIIEYATPGVHPDERYQKILKEVESACIAA